MQSLNVSEHEKVSGNVDGACGNDRCAGIRIEGRRCFAKV